MQVRLCYFALLTNYFMSFFTLIGNYLNAFVFLDNEKLSLLIFLVVLTNYIVLISYLDNRFPCKGSANSFYFLQIIS